MRAVSVCLLLLAVLAGPVRSDTVAETAAAIDAMLAALQRDGSLDLASEPVLAVRALPRLYAGIGNVPVWTDPEDVRAMFTALESVADDGLDPALYHGAALAALGTGTLDDPGDLARRDVLLTDALFMAMYNLIFGKADPNRLDADWNLSEIYDELDVGRAETIDEINAAIIVAIADGEPGRLLDLARPDLPLYLNLRTGYRFYRELAAAGGWPAVPAGPTLREGDTDPRVAVLRERLAVTGDLAGGDQANTSFDADLAAAVIRFQVRHGLDTDGAVGKGTLAALNVPAAQRVDQIRVNLERARWVMNYEVGDDLVLVNVAAYEAWLVRDHELAWRTRVQVGKPYTRTPIFADAMTYLEINPTWTVPASIANKGILAKVKADPGYLATRNMVLLDSQGGLVDPHSVDWSKVSRMPYTVRQEPGPDNALGRVKFIFPNPHAVYLHDTPSKQHFGRSARAFSHGCIRTENPFELAALLLDDQPQWTRAHIDEVVASGKRTTVRLTKPLPVLLLYWTAFMEFDGTVQFRDDLYARDAAVLAELDEPFTPHQRHEAIRRAE